MDISDLMDICRANGFGSVTEAVTVARTARAENERLKAYWWAWRQLSIDLRKDIANDAEGEWRDVLTADCDPHR